MRLIHLADINNRDSNVQLVGVASPPPPVRLAEGKPVTFRRFLAATGEGCHDALQKALGADYGRALVENDPELDIEAIGRPIERTSTVYLSGDGEILRLAPRIVEILFGPDGAERERRDPTEVPPNVLDATPVRWTKLRFRRGDAVRRFAFVKTMQLVHVDGLTYDYLYGIAKQLDAADEMVLLGAGATGKDPLVFQVNGVPWRGFLEGRVDGPRYQLLLRLSNLELKSPESKQ